MHATITCPFNDRASARERSFRLDGLAGVPAAVSRIIHKQTVEGITIALKSVAAPKMNDAQELVVTLTDEQGLPVEGADVYLDLEMPAMPMGRPHRDPRRRRHLPRPDHLHDDRRLDCAYCRECWRPGAPRELHHPRVRTVTFAGRQHAGRL